MGPTDLPEARALPLFASMAEANFGNLMQDAALHLVPGQTELFKEGDPHIRHMEWRDVETAFLGTRRLMALARKTGRRAHILHVSTAEELEYLRDFRDVATVEVLVNHLTQVAPDVYERLQGFGVMNPPIRDRRHYDAAWAALRDGTVDVVGSDHAPHAADLKRLPWPKCPAGLTGVQTIVPVMLGEAQLAQAMARELDALGVYVAGFFFPVVPRGQARIRTQMNAALTRDDLDQALEAFRAAGKATGVLA